MMKSKKRGAGHTRSKFNYQERSAESVQKRAEQQGGKFDSMFKEGVDTWRPKDGENVIRILPPTWDSHDHYGYDIWIHGFVGADRSSYLCPQKMKGDNCPICKAARDAKAAGEEEDAKQLGARRQVAVWIIDRDDDTQTPKLFVMSWSMDRDIAALCHNKRTGNVLLIDHPDEGYDISFTRTGKQLNTRYIGMAIDRDPSPIADDPAEMDRILDFIQENPIPDTLNFYDVDYLERVIEGGAGERDEDLDEEEDEDEPPLKAPKKKVERAPKRSRAEPEEEDEDEDLDEDEAPFGDEDEDEPPVKKSAKRGASAPAKKARRDEPEDDEDLDEDEDFDEEEDEAPARKPAKRGKSTPARRNARRDEDEEEEDLDDDDDFVDEDEDEDEPPAKTRRAPAAAKTARRPARR